MKEYGWGDEAIIKESIMEVDRDNYKLCFPLHIQILLVYGGYVFCCRFSHFEFTGIASSLKRNLLKLLCS